MFYRTCFTRSLIVLPMVTFASGCSGIDLCGARTAPVHVRVRDAVTGKRLADVQVSDVSTGPREAGGGRTDVSGEADLGVFMGWGAKRYGLITTHHSWPSQTRLRFERPGYATLEVPLSNERFVTNTEFLGIGGPPSFSRDVRLVPTQPSD